MLGRAFYLRPTLLVARELLGKILVRRLDAGLMSSRIVDVEAYHQEGDAASHSFRGRTERNSVMFDRGGVLYVYFTYGMHFCMNVVTEEEGIGAAVLIRGMEPLDGIELMRRNRRPGVSDRQLLNGPAKCCQALAVGRAENGASLRGPAIAIHDAPSIPTRSVVYTTRIGIRLAAELPWRCFIKGNPYVSR